MPPTNPNAISPTQWAGLPPSQTHQLVDVRSSSEYSTGHIPTAINIPMDELESRVADLNASATVVLVCQSGMRANLSAARLSALGFEVRVIEGGTSGWAKQNRPLVVSRRTTWSLERQVRLAAGFIVLAGLALANTVSPYWIGLSAFAGLGLTFAGLSDICLMGSILGKMPWNRARVKLAPWTSTP